MKYFLGIPFWDGGVVDLLKTADAEGGLLTVPSAPSLAQMRTDPALKLAYRASDFAVVDGGYVALVLRFVLRERLPRISGLQILQRLIGEKENRAIAFHERNIMFVVPSKDEANLVCECLCQAGFHKDSLHWYVAPFYKHDEDFEDAALLEQMKDADPDWVVLCIGGGRQEKLGRFLRSKANTLKADGRFGSRSNGAIILCTGGAISFFTGSQAKIPTWADRSYLGWFFRICESPGTFLPRYWKAVFELPRLLWDERKSLFAEGQHLVGNVDSAEP